MRYWRWIILLALTLIACNREEEMPLEVEGTSSTLPEGQTVTVYFGIEGAKPSVPTKVLNNDSDLESLWLAVFGSSGYLKEYKQAHLVIDENTQKPKVTYKDYTVEKKIVDEEGVEKIVEVTHQVPVYTYSVELTLTDSPRRIHFIGNAPGTIDFGYDTAIIPMLMSSLSPDGIGEKAYWQLIDLPQGIQALKNEDGNYIDDQGNVYTGQKNFKFQLDPMLQSKFVEVPLIRNWAKIVLYTEDPEESNFTPKSLAVVNFPKTGSIAPYSAKTGFVRNYMNLDFTDLKDAGYPANLPAGTDNMDTSIPDGDAFKADSFEDGARVAGAMTFDQINSTSDEAEKGRAVYIYERPVPTERIPPTYVIIYGHYRNKEEGTVVPGADPDDPNTEMKNEGDYFYKVDLMDTAIGDDNEIVSSYYPIYRNFKYRILVKKILSIGQSTPAAAAVSAGSADVSADISTGHLSEISDGIGRLHLSWMAQSYISENPPEKPVDNLLVYFSKTPDGEPDMEPSSVEYKLLDPPDGGSPVIYNVNIGAPSENDDDGTKGWRKVTFCTIKPGVVLRTQTLRIYGKYNYGGGSYKGRLYRDVVISVQPQQPMIVKCENPKVSPAKGVSVPVSISIPEGLTKTMFPLNFTIEAQDLTLSPDNSKPNNNLPVSEGESISPDDGYKEKQTFHFTRNLSWEEYREAPITRTLDDRTWRTITCYFKTNCSKNATKVWVKNKYFDLAGDEFSNYDFRQIHNYSIIDPVPQQANAEVRFRFFVETDEEGKYPQLTLLLRGMTCEREKNPGVKLADLDTYTFTPTTPENTLILTTYNIDGDISMDISAPGYNTVHMAPYRFNKGIENSRAYGLLDAIQFNMTSPTSGGFWSNVAFGLVQTRANGGNKNGDRGLIFGYYDDPDDPDRPAPIRVTDASGTPIKTNKNNTSGLYSKIYANYNNSSFVDFTNYVSVPSRSSVDPTYHELYFQTNGDQNNSSITILLQAVGYVTETFTYGRLSSTSSAMTRIHSYYANAGTIKSWYKAENHQIKPSSDVKNADYSYFTMDVEPISEGAPDPVVKDDGLYLGLDGATVRGGKYRITFKSGNVEGIVATPVVPECKSQRFFFCAFNIPKSNLPESVNPLKGQYYRYSASETLYCWSAYDSSSEYSPLTGLVDPETTARSIEFVVGQDHPVIISGFLYKAVSNYTQ